MRGKREFPKAIKRFEHAHLLWGITSTENQVKPGDRPTAIKLHTDRSLLVSAVIDTGSHVPAWTEKAKCLDDWEEYSDRDIRSEKDAAAMCKGCEVLDECLAAAMREEGSKPSGDRYGIRGGKTPLQRARLYNLSLSSRADRAPNREKATA